MFKNIFRIIGNRRGWSLMELMVAVGVASVLAIANITLLQKNAENQISIERGNAAEDAARDIQQELKRETICSEFLGPNATYVDGQPLPAPSTPGDSETIIEIENNRKIENATQTVDLYVPVANSDGDPPTVIGTNLYIKRFTIGPYIQNALAGSGNDLLRLNIEFKGDDVYGGPETAAQMIRRELWLKVNPSGPRIDTCAAVGGEDLP